MALESIEYFQNLRIDKAPGSGKLYHQELFVGVKLNRSAQELPIPSFAPAFATRLD